MANMRLRIAAVCLSGMNETDGNHMFNNPFKIHTCYYSGQVNVRMN